MEKLAFVTATWARTENERALILETIRALGAFGMPIVVGNKSRTEFPIEKELLQLPFVEVVGGDMDSLHDQRMRAYERAASLAENIFWIEADKKEFAEAHLPAIISSLKFDHPEVVLPYPDKENFGTYPAFQAVIETCINQMLAAYGMPALHYTYGPVLFPSDLVASLPRGDKGFSWGINAFLMFLAYYKNIPFRAVPIPARHDRDVQGGMGPELLRVRQLKEYVIAIEEAMKLAYKTTS